MKTALPLIFQSRSIYPEQMKKLYGDDLPEFGEFLEGWIQFLRQDHQPDILIEEAEKFLASMKDS